MKEIQNLDRRKEVVNIWSFVYFFTLFKGGRSDLKRNNKII
jgi:hypothetical protein